MQPCYITKPPQTPPGEPIRISKLRSGNKFRYSFSDKVYIIHSTDPIKIKRPDGWIVRCGDDRVGVWRFEK